MIRGIVGALLLSLGIAPPLDAQERTPPPPPPPVWDLTAHLTAERRATNEEVYAALEPDPYDAENPYDRVAWGMIERWGEEAPAWVTKLSRVGDPERLAAGSRAMVYLAQKAAEGNDFALAASLSLDVYLSSAPHRVRLEALRVYARAADPAESAPRIEAIRSGEQDARFQPLLPELDAARAERSAEASAADSLETPQP